MNLQAPPAVAPLDDSRRVARQAHLEAELARGGASTRGRLRLARGGILVVAGLAAATLLLTGRGGGADVEAKALAAVSRGPYLGIVARPDHDGLLTLVHFETHTTERVHTQSETWFDTRKHGAVSNVGGCVRWVGPETHTACVGEFFSGGDLSRAIIGSIDRYRAALASGRVTRAGTGMVRGRQASWLRIAPAKNRPRYDHSVDYVAVDDTTGNPLRIETRNGKRIDGEDLDVITQTAKLPAYIPRRVHTTAADRVGLIPVMARRLALESAHGGRTVTLAQAKQLVPGAVWAGRSVAGQAFRRARVLTLVDGKKQLEILYGGRCPNHCVLIKQGLEAGWAPDSRIYKTLPDESVFIAGGRSGSGRAGSIVLRLEGTSRAAILATALALRPLAP
jgi:hypothetical protein